MLTKRGGKMVLTLSPFFPHRRNRDGTFDSICLKCLLTIANSRTEADLAKHDKSHVCNPSILSQQALIVLGSRSKQSSLVYFLNEPL
jgi:hypothetical protein